MCRSIKPLFNFEPAVTEEEILEASLQFVRKISGIRKPSKVNEAAFQSAVAEIAHVSGHLLASLKPSARPKKRDEEIAKMKARSALRYPNRSNFESSQAPAPAFHQ